MQILSDILLQYIYIYNQFDTLYNHVMIFPELPPALPITSLYCKSFERR